MIAPGVAVITREGTRTTGADPDGVYQIGSLSKVFTALLLAREVVDGTLSLDTTVADLVPQLRDAPVAAVSLGGLATHTSGLPRLPPGLWRKMFGAGARNPYADIDAPTLYAGLQAVRLGKTSRPAYSNLGFGLLGTALGRHLGTSYDAAVRARITEPLGMPVTRTQPDEHLRGHTRRGRPHRQLWTFDAMAGAGALWSSVTDLAVFVRAQVDPPGGSLGDAIRLTHETRVRAGRMEQALAWMRLSGKDGSLLWHNGGTAGFRSFAGVDVGRHGGVVVLGNTDRSVDREGFRLARMLHNA